MAGDKICSVAGCGKPVKTKGLCNAHYLQDRRAKREADMSVPRCGAEGCTKAVRLGGFCGQHYVRFKHHGDPFAGRAQNGACAEFLKRAASYNSDECLIWPFNRMANGYGQINSGSGRTSVASRRVCEIVHGPAPAGKYCAAHSCGKGHEGCVNGRHLRWARYVENSADMIGHGTVVQGEKHGQAILTESGVRQIRKVLGHGSSMEAKERLAQQLGIAVSALKDALYGVTWKHLD